MSAPEPNPDRVPPPWGKPLTEADYANLAASWITRELADQAMLCRVSADEGREAVGQKGNRDCTGILIPYYWPGESFTRNYRVRRDNPDWTEGKDGKPKPDRKYLGPPGSGNRLYIPPGVTLEQLRDVAIPIAIVEGEKKALALQKLSQYEVETPRFIPVGIAGVWNWRGTVGKANGPRGERIDLKGPIADLDRIDWSGRRVLIIFDTNVHSSESVKWARKGIARELATRGAKVDFINLPADCGVNGIDDLLVLWGALEVLKLFENPISGAQLHVVLPPQFQSRPEGMFRVAQTGERLSEIQLSNFRAAIKTNILLDDGVETNREFEIESELLGRPFRLTIPASEFARMDWPLERMGPAAITFPNQREYTRTAIQSHSMAAEERCIYTHTGWRKVDGHWLYVHAGGAIGEAGKANGVNVQLCGPLSKYELRLPVSADELKRAVRTSLRLVELGPPSISFPLRAATCRAVFGDSDFSLHLVGETGVFKSELAALEQQHFGALMSRLHLPGTWSSTGNALELLAFHAKDALMVIDDFAPHGSAADVNRYHASADRVLRAAGNHTGRGRLDSTARLRESKPPRGLILSTGEDIPRGHSVRARLLILDIYKGAIKSDKLAECQRHAALGVFAEATGAFVQWIARSYDDLHDTLKRRVSDLRLKAMREAAHARTPEIIANLQAGFEVYLEFAEECRAIEAREREDLANRCWDALGRAAAAQAKHQAATEPTGRFLDLLRGCLSSGRAHLASRQGTTPERSPESCGWRLDAYAKWSPHGSCVGWMDDDAIYLEATAAYRVAQMAGRDAGEELGVSEQTLKKRLRDKKLLASIDEKRETLTVRRSICGSTKDVLHFCRSTLLLDDAEESDGSNIEIEDAGPDRGNVGFPCREISPHSNQPDMDSTKGVNGLGGKCRECRVFTTGESPGEFISHTRQRSGPHQPGPATNLTAKPNLESKTSPKLEPFGSHAKSVRNPFRQQSQPCQGAPSSTRSSKGT
jgi:hypothetical protein